MSYEQAILATVAWTLLVAAWWYAGVRAERRTWKVTDERPGALRPEEVLPPITDRELLRLLH